MNYKESQLILDEIKKSNKILLNCHRSPDPDSIGSALALQIGLLSLGKEVEIICPSDELYENVNYLKGYEKIKKSVDFTKFDFSKYDLFITTDSASLSQISRSKDFKMPNIKTIVIDHHFTNDRYGEINLIDDRTTSVGEMLFLIFEDWGIEINKDISDCLMAGIVGDTGAFRYPGANVRTFKIAERLMELGADKDRAVHELYRSEPFELIKFYGEILLRAQIDNEYGFVWSAIPYDVYEKLGKPSMAKESAASLFAQVVKDTDFGFIALEQEKGKLAISFRSRTGLDTSKIAGELGGGGHIYASGGKVEGLSFDEAVEKVLSVCRKYANKKA